MEVTEERKAILVLADGRSWVGKAAGKIGQCTGEICFNTGMTGYQEVFTDPSYFGQVLVTTNAHIGNYGTKKEDAESDRMKISGLVCKNFTDKYSRPLADSSIQSYFESEDMVGIYDVDTRAIVRHIRDKGAMNAIISSEELDLAVLLEKVKKVPSMEGLELASKVSTKNAYEVGEPDAENFIVALDFGIKKNILNCFVERNCRVKVFPAKTNIDRLTSESADGYFLSNGPGDPGAMDYAISTVRELLKTGKPIFGICLGHQLLALANDIPTYKMHHGHRGANHPVKNMLTGKCEITTQNHGFGVSPEELKKRSNDIDITHTNLNDETIEGIKIKGKPAFSVQFHPEAAPGPHDSRYLFDEFISLIKQSK